VTSLRRSALVDVRGLTKGYGRLAALSGASLSVRQGEVLGLIGPNGSGKITLFECLAGVLPADAGPCASTGIRCRRAPVAHIFSMVPMRLRRGLHKPSDGRSISPSATSAGLRIGGTRSSIGWHWASSLARRSGPCRGERNRAVLAVGLLTPHPVLLIDEPFDGLDLRQSRDLAVTLRGHAAEGRTLFLSVHQISDAARLCDRFVLLSAGVGRGEGTLDELAALVKGPLPPAKTRDLEEIVLALTKRSLPVAARQGVARADGFARLVGDAAADWSAGRCVLHQRGADLRRIEVAWAARPRVLAKRSLR
jgi:ABC-2 type transport system ATP-binding protein